MEVEVGGAFLSDKVSPLKTRHVAAEIGVERVGVELFVARELDKIRNAVGRQIRDGNLVGGFWWKP